MRKMVITGLVGASLGLASCGSPASIHQAVSSLGSSPDLQLRFTASVTGPDGAHAKAALKVLSLDMNYSNPSGAALSQSNGTANAEILIHTGTQTLADLRVINSNVYVMANISAVASIPGVTLPAAQIAPLQLLFGGRWFELPKSLIASISPTPTSSSTAQANREAAFARRIFDELSKLISNTASTSLPNGGYSQTGTLASVLKAISPTIDSLSGKALPPRSVKGTYTLTVTASGTTATGGSITVTAPSASSHASDSVSLHVTAAHAKVSIVAPTGVTVITPSLFKGLLSQARG